MVNICLNIPTSNQSSAPIRTIAMKEEVKKYGMSNKIIPPPSMSKKIDNLYFCNKKTVFNC